MPWTRGTATHKKQARYVSFLHAHSRYTVHSQSTSIKDWPNINHLQFSINKFQCPGTAGDQPQMLSSSAYVACMCAKSLQSCPVLCDPMDCSPLDSSVYGIFQAGILAGVGCHFLFWEIFLIQGSNLCLLHLCVSCILAGGSLTTSTWEAPESIIIVCKESVLPGTNSSTYKKCNFEQIS